MFMMKKSYLILFGFGLILSAAAQEMSLLGDSTNTTMDLDVSVDSEKVRSKNSLPTTSIITDGFKEGQIGVPESDEETVTTNQVVDSKLRFFVSAGLKYTDEGEFEDAERAYLRALEVDPDNEDILFRQGTLYVGMERYADAIKIFEKMFELYPENPMMHNNLAWCYATVPDVRNVKKALRHAREAIMSAPKNASMWNTLAETYYVAGDYDKARRSTDHALLLLSLRRPPPSKETVESFQAQRIKIILAQEALKMLEGGDDD